jgi:hypothetical protein
MKGEVVFLGAADHICAAAIKRFKAAGSDHEVVAIDRTDSVRSADISGASLIVLGAGPYGQTAQPIVELCLEAGVGYLDINDDIRSHETILGYDQQARAAGIPLYVGCGASPGLTNVWVRDAASELDDIETIDICWAVGDERPTIETAVLEHLMDIVVDNFRTWENGGWATHEPFGEMAKLDLGPTLGAVWAYEMGHPEAITLPALYPQARRIRVLGRLDPAPFNGLVGGLGQAVREGKMSSAEAVSFLEDLLEHKLGTIKGWKASLGGMRQQNRRGDSASGQMWGFLAKSAIRQTYPYRAALQVTVAGHKGDQPRSVLRRSNIDHNAEKCWSDLVGVTGAVAAAFTHLALNHATGATGALPPEAWADPGSLYQALLEVGVPTDQVLTGALSSRAG